MWDKAKVATKWYWQTSALIGVPVLMILLLIGSQKVLFTGTCHLVGWRCEYALGATDAMTDFMGQLLTSNQGMDIVTRPRNK